MKTGSVKTISVCGFTGYGFFILFIWGSFSVQAQIGSSSTMTDRYGTFYAYSAKSIGSANGFVYQNLRYFSGTALRNTGATTVNEKIKDMNNVLGLNFGFSEDLDLILNLNLYQTANRAPSITNREVNSFTKTAFILDDFYLNGRFIPFSFAAKKINLGFLFTAKFEGQGIANSPFQKYTAGNKEAGITLLTSYFRKPNIPDESMALHLNLQYWNHLDKGRYVGFTSKDSVRSSLADSAFAKANSAALRYSLGFSYPVLLGGRYLYIIADIYGTNYLAKPPAMAYSRQNYGYFAIGLKYHPISWLGLHLGGEYQIIKSSDPTTSNAELKIADLTVSNSDYPKYRIFAGISFPFSPRAVIIKSDDIILTEEERISIKRKEVEEILYSEQEIQRRSVNFRPVTEMRKIYKTSINTYVEVLMPYDKKPVEDSEEETE